MISDLKRPATSKLGEPRHAAVALLIGLATLLGCASHGGPTSEVIVDSPVSGDAVPWTSLAIDDEPGDFDFAVVTDRTGEHREHVFRDAMPKLNLIRPAFVVSVGDLIEGYTEDRDELKAQWDEFEGFIDPLAMPFFYLPGNHDMSNDVMAEVWRERFGASYYHFRYKDVLFVMMNSELLSMVSKPGTPVGGPDSPAAQMAYVEKVLAENRDARWTMVFVHQPFWDYPEIHPDWLKVEEWLGDRPFTVFAGHIHSYTLHRRNNRDFITLATTGGGSPMRGLLYGEFDHVMQISMRKDGPVAANLMLDGIQPIDVRDEDIRDTSTKLEKAVRAGSARLDSDAFTSGQLKFNLYNDGDAPMAYEGRFVPNGALSVAANEISGEVPPNSVVPILVDVSSAKRTPFEELAPGRIDWTLSTTSRGGHPISIGAYSSVAPERLFRCAASDGIAVDGDLGDWGVLPFDGSRPAVIERPRNVHGASDISFRFDVRCADDYAYFAVDVVDDSIVASPERVAREQDSVRIIVDSRPDPKRSSNGDGFFNAIRDGTFATTVSLGGGPEANPARDSVFDQFMPKPPEGVVTASRRTEAGYSVEFAVPVSVLDRFHGEKFDALRIEVSVNDFDEGDVGHSTLWWKPSRFSPEAIPGSGTFERP